MDLKLYMAAVAVTFVAELPDKTAFASFIMSTQKRPLAVFVGGASAMVVHTVIAVAFGSLLSLLPAQVIRILSGCLFLVFAFFMWHRKREDGDSVMSKQKPENFLGIAATSFVVIFVAEWGDLTQFSTATLAAKYHSPWTIFLAAVTGLWAAIGLAGWLGSKVGVAFSQKTLQRLAAAVFALVGLWILFG